MNLYLRLLIIFLTSFFKPKIADILTTSVLRLRVWPNDLDLNAHMNNGRYLTIMDLGRLDLVMRTGLLKVMMRRGCLPVLSAASIRYRQPLAPFQPYHLETQVICWDDKWVYLEQRFILCSGPKAGAVAAIAVLKGSFWDRRSRVTVPTPELLKILGTDRPSPSMPDHVAQWQKAEDSLKSVTAV